MHFFDYMRCIIKFVYVFYSMPNFTLTTPFFYIIIQIVGNPEN